MNRKFYYINENGKLAFREGDNNVFSSLWNFKEVCKSFNL